MQITVFGASGRVGRLVVSSALDRGHQVIAFVHNNNPFDEQDRLTIVQGDVTDEAAVTRSLNGSSAVISTLGSWKTKHKDIVSAGTAVIIPAMEAEGLTRIITLTGVGALLPGEKPNLLGSIGNGLLRLVAPKILADGEKHLALLSSSPLNWTSLRAPGMKNGKSTTYHLRLTLGAGFPRMTRAAVAASLVDQLEDSTFSRKAPAVTQK